MRGTIHYRQLNSLGKTVKALALAMMGAMLLQVGTPVVLAAPAGNVTLEAQEKVSMTEMDITVGKSNLVNLKVPVARVSVGNPEVVGVNVLSPVQVYVLGKTVGSTNVMFWDKADRVVAVFDIYVTKELGAVTQEIRKAAAGGDVKVRSVGDSVVLEGRVPDARTAARVAELAEAFAGKKVINMLTVDGVHQVVLAVKIAEINRTLSDRLGINLDLAGAIGIVDWNVVSNLVGTDSAGAGLIPQLQFQRSGQTGTAFGIEAQKQDGLIKILAEPNIVAMSGQEGSFLAGGEILIPVASTQGSVTLETKEFGVGLRFTPTVLEGGRISMRVLPEVTEVVGFQSVGTGGSSAVVPMLSTRRVSTTVELRDGQSLAIGGLLKNNVKEAIKRLPILGEIPIIGALFRSSEFQTDKTELLIIVTPRLIKPLGANYQLPTDAFVEPSRSEFFLQGRMEGKPVDEMPAPVGNAGHQLK